MFSSLTDNWNTPRALFDGLNNEFAFETDVCASKENHLCDRYFDRIQDGLKQQWRGSCWCNPPYGKAIAAWMEKAYFSTRNPETVVVCLVPARTDTQWWHKFIMKAEEIRFCRGRIRFSGHKSNAPFPSAIVVFGRKHKMVERNES